jgi:D-3-phosphoglycerate dehydrogenase
MVRIVIADSLDEGGLELLRASGASVHVVTKEEKPRLAELLADADALVVRSATKVTAELLAAAPRLRVVGRAGIGVDNVDVAAATERGVLVVNAPTANLISATEHTFALLLGLARNIAAADAAMKQGVWDRTSFVGAELQQKTLGVIGFGRIGQQVAIRAKAFDMKVVAYDPYLDPDVARRLGVEPLTLDELLRRSDAITLHTPMTEETRGLIGAPQLALLPEGAMVVNCGRGGLIDETALLAALDAGRIAGAALDVFEEEPPTDWALAKHPKVVATPHIGAQTREAQERIALETARMVLAALEGSLSIAAVNLPFRSAGQRGEPFLALGERLGRLASELVVGGLKRIRVECTGIEEGLVVPISVAAVKGALGAFLGDTVNYVNAEHIAAARGIKVARVSHQGAESDHQSLVRVEIEGVGSEVAVGGTLFAGGEARVVRFGDFPLEFRPEGRLLVLKNRDVPGVVGKLGNLLGNAGINIADIHLARRRRASGTEVDALAVLRLDHTPGPEVLAQLRELPEVERAELVDLGD